MFFYWLSPCQEGRGDFFILNSGKALKFPILVYRLYLIEVSVFLLLLFFTSSIYSAKIPFIFPNSHLFSISALTPHPFLLSKIYRLPFLTNLFELLISEHSHVCVFCCLVTKSCPSLWDPMGCSIPGFPVLHYLLEFNQTHDHWVMSHNHLVLCHPLIPFPSILASVRVFSNESALHVRWQKY